MKKAEDTKTVCAGSIIISLAWRRARFLFDGFSLCGYLHSSRPVTSRCTSCHRTPATTYCSKYSLYKFTLA